MFQDNIAFLSNHGCLLYKKVVLKISFYDKETFVSRKTRSMLHENNVANNDIEGLVFDLKKKTQDLFEITVCFVFYIHS